MNVLDFIILAILALSMVIGFFKGLIKQLLTVVGIVVVAMLTAIVAPYVQNWFASTEMAEGTRSAVAMFATVILLAVVYSILAMLVSRLLKRFHLIKMLDRLLGGAMGIVVVYLVFAVIFALILNTSAEFLPKLKSWLGESFGNGFFGTKIYKNNFFGDWVINDIAEKLIKSFKPAA